MYSINGQRINIRVKTNSVAKNQKYIDISRTALRLSV